MDEKVFTKIADVVIKDSRNSKEATGILKDNEHYVDSLVRTWSKIYPKATLLSPYPRESKMFMGVNGSTLKIVFELRDGMETRYMEGGFVFSSTSSANKFYNTILRNNKRW